jgi:SWI/SNF-related matrix-associated actin-dependent regulator 1 of chromatin subfamily A
MATRAAVARTVPTWILLLALTACGTPKPASDAAGVARVTFRTDPPAQVWVDGQARGSTPVVVALPVGVRQVELRADGFQTVHGALTVEAGLDLTVESALQIAAQDEAGALDTLTAALGIERDPHTSVELTRGVHETPVLLYWPRGRVRHAGLGTYRIEVGAEYEGDGVLEFRKGRKVLHQETFQPQAYVTEKALPAEVMEAARRGTHVTWGVYFEGTRRKPVTATFDVRDGRRIARRLAKLEHRQVYQAAKPIEREMARIELLRSYRYDTEALTASLSVLNTWPETELPFPAMAACLGRMHLRDSSLYQEVAHRLRGGKSHRGSGGGLPAPQTSRPLPPAMIAPRVRPESAPAALRPGGLGVHPTPDAEKRDPGPIPPAPEATPGSVPAPGASPRGTEDARRAQIGRDLQQARRDVEELTTLRRAAQTAESRLVQARDEAKRGQEDVAAAQQALAAAEKSGDADAIHKARADLEASQARQADADKHLQESEQQKQQADRDLQEAQGRLGDAQQRADDLQARLQQSAGAGGAAPGTPGSAPVRPATPAGPPTVAGARENLADAQRNLNEARRWVQDAQTAVDRAQAALAGARKAVAAAEGDTGAVDAAAATLQGATASGDAAAITAAEQALQKAEQDHQARVAEANRGLQGAQAEATRAGIDAARAGVAERQGHEAVESAQKALDEASQRAGPDDGTHK